MRSYLQKNLHAGEAVRTFFGLLDKDLGVAEALTKFMKKGRLPRSPKKK